MSLDNWLILFCIWFVYVYYRMKRKYANSPTAQAIGNASKKRALHYILGRLGS